MTWRTVKLGDILKRKKNLVEIEDDKEYKLVTVRLFHKGVTLRKVAKGEELSSSKMHSVKAGEFILSGIDARHGAFGLIPAELEGAVISNDFWCLSFDKEIIEKQFFLKLTSTTYFDDLCKKASEGTTNRVRLQADKFFNLEINLPPIEAQKDFVQRYSKTEESKSLVSTELDLQLALVKELRQAYLREAMQGKLVPQDPTDEPAEILLEKIKAEKEKLVAEKRLKRDKPLPPIKPEELPFEIPSNWEWCRLGDISMQVTDGEHQTPPRISEGRMLLSAKNVRDGFIDFDNVDFISEEHYQKSIKRCKPEKGDVLIVSVGATIGRSTILDSDREFALVRSVALIKPFVLQLSKFFKFVLDSPILQKEISGRKWGTAQPCLYLNQIKELTIPLPPLTEQEKIVAKLEKLIKFCDELEANIKQGITNADRLLQTALREALEPKK